MKGKIIIVAALLLVILGLTLIRVEVAPPADTRVILEYTYQVYITPPCFEQAEKTNNLGEVKLSRAIELNMKPESGCTEESLKPVKKPLYEAIAIKTGLVKSDWDW